MGQVLEEVRYEIDRKFDKVGVFTTFDDLPVDRMGYVEWPKDMSPSVVGTPVDVRKHMMKVRKESEARNQRGERAEYYIAIWIDGAWILSNTKYHLYYIIDASYSGKKPYEIYVTNLVDQD